MSETTDTQESKSARLPAFIEEPEVAEYRKRQQKLDEMALDNALGLQVLLSREIQKYFDPTGAPSYKKLSDESSAILANLATAAKNALCEH